MLRPLSSLQSVTHAGDPTLNSFTMLVRASCTGGDIMFVLQKQVVSRLLHPTMTLPIAHLRLASTCRLNSATVIEPARPTTFSFQLLPQGLSI